MQGVAGAIRAAFGAAVTEAAGVSLPLPAGSAWRRLSQHGGAESSSRAKIGTTRPLFRTVVESCYADSIPTTALTLGS